MNFLLASVFQNQNSGIFFFEKPYLKKNLSNLDQPRNLNLIYFMKIEFNNLYTHFVFITLKRQPVIPEKSRIRIEKYIPGIVKNNSSKTLCHLCQP